MKSNALLITFIALAISAAAAPLKLASSQDAGALVERSYQARHHQAKGDYHPLPRDLPGSLSGEVTVEQARRAAGDLDLTKNIDLTNNNGDDQSGQGGNTHTSSGPGSGPSPGQLSGAIQSNKGSGLTMPTGACHSSGACGTQPDALSLQGLGPDGPGGAGQLGLPSKAYDTVPTSSGGPSADNASPDASKQDTNNTTTTSLTTTTAPTPAPAPTAPVVGTPLPMNLLATALIDIIRAFEKATTPISTAVTTSLAAAPTPAPGPTPVNTTTPGSGKPGDNTPDDAKSADPAAAGADSADSSVQDAAGSGRDLSDTDSVDGPFKWIVMRSTGAGKPDAASAKRTVDESSPAADKVQAAKRRILDFDSDE
ncbi:hypothetical protein BCV69DRAFT_295893 [Microstroma glucosiphilum]|uniref:Uncharacterized protein n=1 Tax=Pseudomicrostroma glucosiphilum TaxID=1684307 RepID=A0A316UF59_9BASI|nr:hypothetical protein BCV69DRAFT_295893 [Pseudomicrostroma glucosiphilum]PWN23568.1 hypothetical protein BCV69DRAFT_295893 [Pseudomicrostroma glucosiphilum]